MKEEAEFVVDGSQAGAGKFWFIIKYETIDMYTHVFLT